MVAIVFSVYPFCLFLSFCLIPLLDKGDQHKFSYIFMTESCIYSKYCGNLSNFFEGFLKNDKCFIFTPAVMFRALWL